VQFLGRLIISSGSTKLEVVVENYAAGSPCAHSCGAFCFMLPLPPGKTGLKLGSVESSMLSIFTEHFDRIVQTRRPGSLDSLMAAMIGSRNGFQVVKSAGRR
jgi:hypothetical protein